MYIKIDLLCYFIKFLGVNIGFGISLFNLIKRYKTIGLKDKVVIIISNIALSLLQIITKDFIPTFLIMFPIIFIYSISIYKKLKASSVCALSISIISLALSYIFSLISILIAALLYATFSFISNINYIVTTLMAIINISGIILLFKHKRVKNGFTFLDNEYINIFILLTTIILVFSYAIGNNYYLLSADSKLHLFFTLLPISVIILVILKEAFVLYQKQKLQTQALKDYEKELAETKQKLQTAIEEKDKITKSNHEFYHRQEALMQKLNTIANSQFNTETAEELSSITSRINTLSNQYQDKLKALPPLTPTGFDEIDDMLSYFQKECSKSNIDFIFKLNCNINKIIDNYISESDLATLIGDLTRNAVIAINHSQNTFRSIMIVIGLTDNNYQLDIYDSGINFEIATLLNFGIKKASTHLNEGGTGIGLLTTYETLQKCKASLMITEYDSNNYTKSIGICFNNLSEYTIITYRHNQIKQQNVKKRNIIIEPLKSAFKK